MGEGIGAQAAHEWLGNMSPEWEDRRNDNE
jgi:hypothetical protein